jgi:hypothetical protein
MGLEFTISNFIQIFGLLSPLFLGTFLVLVSVFNQNIKGLIYLLFVLLTSAISYIISILVKYNEPSNQPRGDLCNLVNFPLMSSQYTLPNFNSVFISFTFMYLLLPMVVNNEVNFWVVGLLTTLFAVDVYVKISNYCTDMKGVFVGLILGFFMGSVSYFILKMNELESLLFFNDLTSNNVVCKRPSKQSFKCQLYKNGMPVTSI